MKAPGLTRHGDPVPGVVRTQLQAILERDRDADPIALVWHEPLSEPVVEQTIAGEPVRLVACSSELAIREALVNHRGHHKLVILSPFHQGKLGRDVLARLWRNEPQQINPWRTLQQFTDVSAIDPRLTHKKGRWMAEALVDCFDRYRAHMVFGEVLDLDSAWLALARGYLAYEHNSLELPELLRWSLRDGAGERIKALPAPVREHLGDWLHPALPGMGPLVEVLIRKDQAQDLVPLGLVCSLLTNPELPQGKVVDAGLIYAARGRFVERFLGGETFDLQVLARFGDGATDTVKGILAQSELKTLGPVLDKAEQILASLDLTPALVMSPLLPGGLQQRFDRFASSLTEGLKKKDASAAEAGLQALQDHWLSGLGSRRDQLQRAEMALRLLRWHVGESSKNPASLSQLLDTYVTDGSYVDWARSQLWSGEDHEGLNHAYHGVLDAVTERRQQQNRTLADHLPAIARGDALPPHLVPVEKAIECWLDPLTAPGPVLLVVLDGMSTAIYRELQTDFAAHGWVEVVESTGAVDACLISALPSITQVSRCSLLSGRLSSGDAQAEKIAFADHPLLKKRASTRFPPVLLHKQELQHSGSGALAPNARGLIAGTEHRVVAVVINAIDDQLSSSSQVSVRWDFRAVPILRQVLEAARDAGRTVIVTSDHGHILDHDTQFADSGAGDRGERYLTQGRPATAEEVALTGPRVISEHNRVILPWSEKVRYTKARSHGYHGGGSLQEVVIPLGIYVNASDAKGLEGWHEVQRALPSWWSQGEVQVRERSPQFQDKKPKAGSKKRKDSDLPASQIMDDMFAELQPAPGTSDLTKATASSDIPWVSGLFESPVYRQAIARAGRVPFSEEQLSRFLTLFQQQQGTIMETRLSEALSIPRIRLRGFLSAMQKLLNVDGYPVLKVQRDTSTVVLDIGMLKKQFEL